MRNRHFQHEQTKEIYSLSDDELKALDRRRHPHLNEVEVVRVKHGRDGREATLSKDEWNRYSTRDRKEWIVQKEPETQADLFGSDEKKEDDGKGEDAKVDPENKTKA